MSSTRMMVARNPSLKPLEMLSGRWDMEIRWSPKTHKLVGGPATVRGATRFEWIEDGHFLVHHQGGADGAPDARWLMGRDESSGVLRPLRGRARRFAHLPDELREPCLAALEECAGLLPAFRRAAQRRQSHHRGAL